MGHVPHNVPCVPMSHVSRKMSHDHDEYFRLCEACGCEPQDDHPVDKGRKIYRDGGDEIDVEASDQNLKSTGQQRPAHEKCGEKSDAPEKKPAKEKAVFSSAPNRCMPVWFPAM